MATIHDPWAGNVRFGGPRLLHSASCNSKHALAKPARYSGTVSAPALAGAGAPTSTSPAARSAPPGCRRYGLCVPKLHRSYRAERSRRNSPASARRPPGTSAQYATFFAFAYGVRACRSQSFSAAGSISIQSSWNPARTGAEPTRTRC